MIIQLLEKVRRASISFSKTRRLHQDLTKRQKLIVATSAQSLVYLLVALINQSSFWPTFVISLCIVAGFTLWTLWEELADVKYGMLLVLPIFLFGSLVYFVRMTSTNSFLTFLSVFLYGFGAYSLLLTQNIYNVAAIRTIQLVRAANAVGFLFTLVCAFFIFSVIWGARLHPWALAILVGSFSLPLTLQSLWSVDLEERVSKRLFGFSLLLSLVAAEIAFTFAFWPILPTIGALAIVVTLYVLLGLSQFYISQRLLGRTVWEYVGVAVVIMTLILVTTKWGV